jgi:hypothetical protein
VSRNVRKVKELEHAVDDLVRSLVFVADWVGSTHDQDISNMPKGLIQAIENWQFGIRVRAYDLASHRVSFTESAPVVDTIDITQHTIMRTYGKVPQRNLYHRGKPIKFHNEWASREYESISVSGMAAELYAVYSPKAKHGFLKIMHDGADNEPYFELVVVFTPSQGGGFIKVLSADDISVEIGSVGDHVNIGTGTNPVSDTIYDKTYVGSCVGGTVVTIAGQDRIALTYKFPFTGSTYHGLEGVLANKDINLVDVPLNAEQLHETSMPSGYLYAGNISMDAFPGFEFSFTILTPDNGAVTRPVDFDLVSLPDTLTAMRAAIAANAAALRRQSSGGHIVAATQLFGAIGMTAMGLNPVMGMAFMSASGILSSVSAVDAMERDGIDVDLMAALIGGAAMLMGSQATRSYPEAAIDVAESVQLARLSEFENALMSPVGLDPSEFVTRVRVNRQWFNPEGSGTLEQKLNEHVKYHTVTEVQTIKTFEIDGVNRHFRVTSYFDPITGKSTPFTEDHIILRDGEGRPYYSTLSESVELFVDGEWKEIASAVGVDIAESKLPDDFLEGGYLRRDLSYPGALHGSDLVLYTNTTGESAQVAGVSPGEWEFSAMPYDTVRNFTRRAMQIFAREGTFSELLPTRYVGPTQPLEFLRMKLGYKPSNYNCRSLASLVRSFATRGYVPPRLTDILTTII